MILATYKKDHYELDDGEALSREYPDTFSIPDKEDRDSLQIGDTVKLVFRMEETKGSDDLAVERMWVEITAKHPTGYEGTLANQPAGSECLHHGQLIPFLACHIIDIYT